MLRRTLLKAPFTTVMVPNRRTAIPVPLGWVNVKDYGAVGNGVHDDTAAIQAAVDAITGNLPPAAYARVARYALYFPAGVYNITHDIDILSTIGFHVFGDGAWITFIRAVGTNFKRAMFNIDGSFFGSFTEFTMDGESTAHVPAAIRLDWSTAAARSTSQNFFQRVHITDLKFMSGLNCAGTGTRQLDGTTLSMCLVSGGQAPGNWSSKGYWQKGVVFGNGSWGNNYNHYSYNSSVSGCYHGYEVNVSSLSIYGAEPAANFTDIWIVPAAQCTFDSIQSQVSGKFLYSPVGYTPSPVTISATEFNSLYLTDGHVIDVAGGLWEIRNFSAPYGGNIRARGGGVYRPCSMNASNVSLRGKRTDMFELANTEATVLNYRHFDYKTGNYATRVAGDLISTYSGTTWHNVS